MAMMQKTLARMGTILLAAGWLGQARAAEAAGNEGPALVPMPKIYHALGRTFGVAGRTLYVAQGNRQCEIAAVELTKRIVELGANPGPTQPVTDTTGPGIYIVPVSHPAAQVFIQEHALAITAADPGPQGYVIRTCDQRVIVIGSDNVGVLYGAMTLRQMLMASNGGVTITAADVYDRPDYHYRVGASYWRQLGLWGTGEKDQTAALKAGVNWLLRLKINLIQDYKLRDPRETEIKAAYFECIKEVNAYARDRGIYAGHFIQTRVGLGTFDKGDRFDKWPCYVYPNRGKRFYCWSADDLAQETAARWADFYRDHNFSLCFLHPVDGGGIEDPELWSRRCPECRKRWQDNERWKASIHQYNIWGKVFRERAPGVTISSPIYPYHAGYASHARFPDTSRETWLMNSTDYWDKVHRGTDQTIIPMSWMSLRSLMDGYRAYWNGRPLCVYAHSFISCGYFGTWHRNCKTNHYGDQRDIFLLTGGSCLVCLSRWMNYLCSNEFAWNTLAPGHEYYTGLYYDVDADHTGPDTIMQDWVPRACRAFYGEAVGREMVPVYTAGVQPLYIMDPGQGVALANKMRRRPLADVDPTKNQKEEDVGKPMAPDIVDSSQRMGAQVQAARTALTALKEAYKHIDTLDQYRRKTFLHFYRRMPLWYLTARARHACYVAAEQQRRGAYKSAASALQTGLKNFDADYARVQQVIAQTKGMRELKYYPLLHDRGGIDPRPDKVKQLLEERLASAAVVLKPRRPGEVIKVGIHKGLGEKGTKAFFDTFANVEAEIIESLSMAVLDRYDCVFILQTKSVDRADYFHGLPRYVREGGGGVVFQHDMCGRPGRNAFGKKTPFPEICPNAPGRKDAKTVVAKIAHPALLGAKPNESFEHTYYDHLNLESGKDGTVIVVDDAGDPVVIVGAAGNGKVVFDGNVNLTAADGDERLTGFNARLARGAVEWFTGVALEEK